MATMMSGFAHDFNATIDVPTGDIIALRVRGGPMKVRWKVLMLFSVFLNCIFLFLVSAGLYNQYQMSRPHADTRSGFLKNYNPKDVIDSFRLQEYGSGSGESANGWSADKGYLDERDLDESFAIPMAKGPLLVKALEKNIDDQLMMFGGHTLSTNEGADSGVLIKYRIGDSLGSISISPLALNERVQRNQPLPDGIADVSLRFQIAEKPLH